MMDKQLHAGKLKGTGDDVWHADVVVGRILTYWYGSWHQRTPEELFSECMTIIRDLMKNHPGIEQKKLN